MKIVFFYSKIYYYVTSFHPRLYKELVANGSEVASFVDVSGISISEIKQIEKSADLIIIDNSIIWCIQKGQLKEFNFYIQIFKKQHNAAYFKQIADYLFTSDRKKFFWFHGDLHGLNVSRTKRLDGLLEYKDRIVNDMDGVIVFMHPDKLEKTPPPEYLDDFLREYSVPKELADILTEGKIIIEMPHCADLSEAIRRRKKWDVCVPGISYKTRLLANNSIDKSKAKKLPFQKINKVKYYFDVIINNFISTRRRNGLGYRFIRRLSASAKINFVCGSAYKYLVRKFVEIPLYNTAMICYPVKNIEDYGFIDGTHAIFCNPENAGEVTLALLQDPQRIDRLAKNAYDLVSLKHTTTVRAQQLMGALELLAKDELAASYFKDGEYFYERK